MKTAIGVLLVILVLGVSGCMSIANNSRSQSELHAVDMEHMEGELRLYLEKKYQRPIEIVRLSKEFNGNDGVYFRTVFRGEGFEDEGVLYCYEEGYGSGSVAVIDGISCWIKDDYANVILQNQYAAQLQQLLGDGVMVRCRLETPNHMLSDEEFAQGVKSCLELAEVTPHLYVFVLADASQKGTDLKSRVEAFMGQYNVYWQYLYIGYQTDIDLEEWERSYREHYTTFDIFLAEDSTAEYIEFSAFRLDKGLVKTSIVKG